MCKLCDNKLSYAKVKDGWMYIDVDNCNFSFPIHYCPWCGEKLKGKERMMPRITPRDWKYQMQEQEAEDANS